MLLNDLTSYNMQMSSEPRLQEIFEEVQHVLAGKKELSSADIDQVNQLVELLKEQSRGTALSFPASVIAARNPESVQQYIKGEMDKLAVRYKRNKCKMSLFQLAHQVLSDSHLRDDCAMDEEQA